MREVGGALCADDLVAVGAEDEEGAVPQKILSFSFLEWCVLRAI